MSVNNKGLIALQKKMEQLTADMPNIVNELLVGEGVFAVKQARRAVTKKKIVDSGAYRFNFHAGDKSLAFEGKEEHDNSTPKRKGDTYQIDVYNNLEYADHLEYGFRSHYVPAEYLSSHYRKKFSKGFFVGPAGGFVRGKYVFRDAIRDTKQTKDARLRRKLEKIIKERMK